MNSNPTEEDDGTDAESNESDKGDDGHTAVIDQDMSLDESTRSSVASESNSPGNQASFLQAVEVTQPATALITRKKSISSG